MMQRIGQRHGTVAIMLHEMQGHALRGLGSHPGQATQRLGQLVKARQRLLRQPRPHISGALTHGNAWQGSPILKACDAIRMAI